DPIRTPLTNVPLLLRASRISGPIGVWDRKAWWREASTSGMTMSLSWARPIVTDPDGCSGSAGRARKTLIIRVARLDSSGGLAATGGDIWVCGAPAAGGGGGGGLPAGIRGGGCRFDG